MAKAKTGRGPDGSQDPAIARAILADVAASGDWGSLAVRWAVAVMRRADGEQATPPLARARLDEPYEALAGLPQTGAAGMARRAAEAAGSSATGGFRAGESGERGHEQLFGSAKCSPEPRPDARGWQELYTPIMGEMSGTP